MITPRLESGENVFETLREKFNALAEAVDQLGKLESASPLLDVIDTGAGKLIRWNGTEAEPSAAVSGGTTTVETGYAGQFRVELTGATTARIYDASAPDSLYAGTITVGSSHHDMPAGTLTVSAGFVVYLTVHYDAGTDGLEYSYATGLSSEVAGPRGWYKALAEIRPDGSLRQIHYGGDIEIAGRWCE